MSELGFGCARLGGFFSTGPREDTIRLLRSAREQGVTFFDTSDMYSQGESEELLGAAFAGTRPSVVIASKVGYELPARRKLLARVKPLLRPLVRATRLRRRQLPSFARGSLGQDFSPAHIVAAAEASLRRLRTDYLDLYQLHSPPPAVLVDGVFLEPMERLKAAGKIRYYGVSCETTEDAKHCLRHAGISTLQVRLSLLAQEPIADVVPKATAKGIGIIARECFAGGLLTRPAHALRPETLVPTETERAPKAIEIEAYRRIAAASGRTLAECALQFVIATPGVSVAVVGMRAQPQLEGNLALLAARPLDDAEAGVLRAAASRPSVPGAR